MNKRPHLPKSLINLARFRTEKKEEGKKGGNEIEMYNPEKLSHLIVRFSADFVCVCVLSPVAATPKNMSEKKNIKN